MKSSARGKEREREKMSFHRAEIPAQPCSKKKYYGYGKPSIGRCKGKDRLPSVRWGIVKGVQVLLVYAPLVSGSMQSGAQPFQKLLSGSLSPELPSSLPIISNPFSRKMRRRSQKRERYKKNRVVRTWYLRLKEEIYITTVLPAFSMNHNTLGE